MLNLIKYFIKQKMLTNLIFVGILLSSIIAWIQIGKEEMPSLEMDWLRVSVRFAGSSAEDVEQMVTRPIENELKGISGIYEINTTSSAGISSFRISIDPNFNDKQEVIREIKDSVLKVDLPKEADLPTFRRFKTSEKAIIDIAFIHKEKEFLTIDERIKLQGFVKSFENQLLARKEISSVDMSGYLTPQLKIEYDPQKIIQYQLSISEILKTIDAYNIRAPLGNLIDKKDSQVIVLNELDNQKRLEELVLRNNLDNKFVKLKDIATIKQSFERPNTIYKVQGKEAVILNVKKSISYDILQANKAVKNFITPFKKTYSSLPFNIILMDDESQAVKNRLKLIIFNGLLGFILILIVLMLFLDTKSAFWVAMGIPFSLSFALVCALIAGYTMNNVTLAAIIIVLGIVVDDAIIIAENILRHINQKKDVLNAAIDGTKEMIGPITASIATTCVAFLPLFFFQGRLGQFISFIPLMVIFMLVGSLIESIFILPSHMEHQSSFINRFFSKFKNINIVNFNRLEDKYSKILYKFLNHRTFLMVFFFGFLLISFFIFKTQIKFVMFPREETERMFVKIETTKGSNKAQTAKIIAPVEKMFINDMDKGVIVVRSQIGQSRRGGITGENSASIRLELLPKDERQMSIKKLTKRWKNKVKDFPNIEKIKFIKSRFGRSSGSPIEILVQENNNTYRDNILKELENKLVKNSNLADVEIERPLKKDEIIFELNQKELVRLSINPTSLITVLRSFVEGTIIYKLNQTEDEVEVIFTVNDKYKTNLNSLLQIKIENSRGQLIDLKKVILIRTEIKPISINRYNYKRTGMIYADLKVGSTKTPLDIATVFETKVFPNILKKYPSSIVSFIGEVKDSRESKLEFLLSIFVVITLTYFILILVFNSLVQPFIIIAIIPFALASISWILLAHGMTQYGFFTIIGSLGMIGVVVNDSIVMVAKLNSQIKIGSINFIYDISKIASTRLRAIILTTVTTVVAILPTAYGIAGYDSMLADMMLTMGWGLAFATIITLVLTPCLYSFYYGFIIKNK